MPNVIFPCGCKFERKDDGPAIYVEPGDELPPIKVHPYKFTLLCGLTWDIICEGKTVGVFQIEKHAGKKWSRAVKPDDLEYLGALNALIRPGCVRAMSGDPPKSMTQRYVDRRHGRETVEYFNVPELEPILKSTYGILTFQEQSTKIAEQIAGFNLQEADILRKAIGKKKAEMMANIEHQFVEGCAVTGIITKEKAQEIFGWIRESQRYSFNRAHAMTYGKNAYWSAYCKAHFPLNFYKSYLKSAKTYEDIEILVNDAKTFDVQVNVPNFTDLKQEFYIKNRELYFGLLNVREIGESGVEDIQTQAKEVELIIDKKVEDWTWEDYLIYFSSRVKSTFNIALINSGALDYFGIPRERMHFEFKKWRLLTPTQTKWIYNNQYSRMATLPIDIEPWKGPRFKSFLEVITACKLPKRLGGGCHDHRQVTKLEDIEYQLKNPPHALEDTIDVLCSGEERYLGISISTHIISSCEDGVKKTHDCISLKHVETEYVVIAVQISEVKEHKTKNGKNPGALMAFLTVRDDTSTCDNLLCFPEEWIKFQDLLFENNTVLIRIEKLKRGGFSVKKVIQI
jgi:DNA polymerase III alpha subunit